MQITLNIQGDQLRDTVEAVFAELTADQKKELATNVLSQFLANPPEYSEAYRRRIATELANKENGRGYSSTYDIDRAMSQVPRSPHEDLLWSLLKEAVANQKQAMADFVSTDPQCQATLAAINEQLKGDFGKYVHDALVALFCKQMGTLGEQLRETMMQTAQVSHQLEGVRQRLAG